LAEVLSKYISGSILRVEKQKRMMAKKTITKSGISKIKIPHSAAEAYVRTLKERSKMMIPLKMDGNVCRDPDDHVVLGLAKAAKADFIITGDNDLLSLARFEGVEIVSPRRFLEKNRR